MLTMIYRLVALQLIAILLVGCTEDASIQATPTKPVADISAKKDLLREGLQQRISALPNNILSAGDRERIELMLNEVLGIEVNQTPNSYGAQIGGHPRKLLVIDSGLLKDPTDFYIKRNLAKALRHESLHWQDLKTSEFNDLVFKHQTEYTASDIARLIRLEQRAYEDDYLFNLKLHQLSSRYRLPECHSYTPGKTLPIEVDAGIFGYGRALMSIHNSIRGLSLQANTKKALFDRSINAYHAMYPDMSKYAGINPIDCNYKLGFST